MCDSEGASDTSAAAKKQNEESNELPARLDMYVIEGDDKFQRRTATKLGASIRSTTNSPGPQDHSQASESRALGDSMRRGAVGGHRTWEPAAQPNAQASSRGRR